MNARPDGLGVLVCLSFSFTTTLSFFDSFLRPQQSQEVHLRHQPVQTCGTGTKLQSLCEWCSELLFCFGCLTKTWWWEPIHFVLCVLQPTVLLPAIVKPLLLWTSHTSPHSPSFISSLKFPNIALKWKGRLLGFSTATKAIIMDFVIPLPGLSWCLHPYTCLAYILAMWLETVSLVRQFSVLKHLIFYSLLRFIAQVSIP